MLGQWHKQTCLIYTHIDIESRYYIYTYLGDDFRKGEFDEISVGVYLYLSQVANCDLCF